MTIREQILDQVGVLLNGAGKPAAVPTAVRTRGKVLRPVDSALPAISYFKGSDRVLPIHKTNEQRAGAPVVRNPHYPVHREVDVIVECVAKATTTTTSDDEVDVLTDWVEKALCGVDATWPGIALGAAVLQTDFDYAQADAEVCQASVLVRVAYTTKAGDSSVRY